MNLFIITVLGLYLIQYEEGESKKQKLHFVVVF